MSDIVTDINALRKMSPEQIVEARRAGTLDLAAIAAHRNARDAKRTERVRQFVANGATVGEAVATAAQIEAAEDAPPPAA